MSDKSPININSHPPETIVIHDVEPKLIIGGIFGGKKKKESRAKLVF